MPLTILYFAWVRERIGAGEEEVQTPSSVRTVADLIDWLSRRGDGYRAAFEDLSRIRAAVDQQFVPFDAPIVGGGEVAFFPPVTGG
ncbi:molybdopterin converting factor subunit 1 [Sphingomonas tabacisoli]|uniref:Molybdopterin synthase sulfur carrier subunit n=1 Tax=Sphingomonas tabacisoli TaxID=2249466 RepID=A0ABW4HZR3_9SPHN